jgi:cleavage stimulation factor subunit 3
LISCLYIPADDLFSYLLTFAYAEAQEIKKEFADVHATYDKFLTLLRSQLETFEQTITPANTSSSTAAVPANGPENGVVNNNSHAPAAEPGIQSTNSSFNTQASDEKPSKNAELQKLRTEYGVAWIMYMRFGRRSEGVKSLRGIFGKGRRDRFIPWEVYEAGGLCFFCSLFDLGNNLSLFFLALMEYHCSDDRTVASRIFERGLDFFSDEIDYVLRYLSFLISINDESSKSFFFSISSRLSKY